MPSEDSGAGDQRQREVLGVIALVAGFLVLFTFGDWLLGQHPIIQGVGVVVMFAGSISYLAIVDAWVKNTGAGVDGTDRDGGGTARCSTESAHDYVVVRMNSGTNQRCLFTVECSRCEDRTTGYYDEIPPARFA